MFFPIFLNLSTTFALGQQYLLDWPLPFQLGATTTENVNNIVDLGYASYLGNHTRTWPNTVSYLGIPYAEPPLGELRFRSPVPLNMSRVSEEAKGEVVDARSCPDACIQGARDSGARFPGGSEDCLKVNIYTPFGVKRNAKLPVLVYIHGGGYVLGNPANYPFEHWIEQSPNVVIVSIYYRLSAFGFLTTPEFVNNASLGDLNAGLLDQIEALRWIQKHIDKFGGDPERVTIDGESAGGASVEMHLIANTGREESLFRGAIAQSVFRTPVPTPERLQPLFDVFVERAGCGSGAVEDKVACLRSANAKTLAYAQDTVPKKFANYNTFRVVVDKKVIMDYPTRLIRKGMFRKVPLVVGATTNDTLSFSQDTGADMSKFFPSLTDESLSALEQAYPSSAFPSGALRHRTLTGDAEIRCVRAIMASAWDTAGINAWTYRYNQPDPNHKDTEVRHQAERYMMFRGSHMRDDGNTTFSIFNPSETAFSQELIAYWLSFVRALDPNAYKLAQTPVWARYTAKERNRIVLNEAPADVDFGSVGGSHVEIEDEDEVQRCELIAGLVGEMEN